VVQQLGAFFDAVGGVLRLDQAAISALQLAPNALSLALTILLLATVSDVIGNSPVLFFNRMRPGRLALAFVIETVLSLIRLAVWMLSLWVLLLLANRGAVNFESVVLVIGIGYAPMLLSFLVIIPTAGPFIGRVLDAWTLVTVTASIAVAVGVTPWEALPAVVVAALVILVVRRTSDRLSVAVLGPLSRRLSGVDLMRRTRRLDPQLVMGGREGS
jgi:hypothetical protein